MSREDLYIFGSEQSLDGKKREHIAVWVFLNLCGLAFLGLILGITIEIQGVRTETIPAMPENGMYRTVLRVESYDTEYRIENGVATIHAFSCGPFMINGVEASSGYQPFLIGKCEHETEAYTLSMQGVDQWTVERSSNAPRHSLDKRVIIETESGAQYSVRRTPKEINASHVIVWVAIIVVTLFVAIVANLILYAFYKSIDGEDDERFRG